MRKPWQNGLRKVRILGASPKKEKAREKHEKKKGKERKHNKGEQHTPLEPFDSKEEVASGVD